MAALVTGVASLVAAISFVLFPLALLAGLAGLVIGIIAIDLSVQLGTWAARNTGVFTRFDNWAHDTRPGDPRTGNRPGALPPIRTAAGIAVRPLEKS